MKKSCVKNEDNGNTRLLHIKLQCSLLGLILSLSVSPASESCTN